MAIRGNVAQESGIVPGEILLPDRSGSVAGDAHSNILRNQQNPAVGCDVLQEEPGGNTEHETLPTRWRHGIKEIVSAVIRSRKPDFVARSRPGQPPYIFPFPRQGLLMAAEIHQRDSTSSVWKRSVVEKRNPVTFLRKTRMTHPPGGFVAHFADWILQAVSAIRHSHDDQISAWCPSGIPHMFQYFPRSTARKRCTRQRRVRGMATTRLPQSVRPVNFPPRSAILAIVAALSKPAAPCCHLKSPRDSPD